MPYLTLAAADSLTPFLLCAGVVAAVMLLWDTIEVGRNDAANLINAVFGARVLTRRAAVMVAAAGVILGACASEGVIETARKGIFDPKMLTLEQAISVYIAVYIVDTIMLYGYSAYGMPVSTTATLVFSLLGASLSMRIGGIVDWGVAGKIIGAIFLSIFITGVVAFFVQRAVRGAVRDRAQNLSVALAHGGWIGGGMLAALCYFMLVKGMRHTEFVSDLNEKLKSSEIGTVIIVITLWTVFAIAIHALLVLFGKKAARSLFPVLAVIGTFAMAFSFGQNDLANAASPGLAIYNLIDHRAEGVVAATDQPLPMLALLGCGVFMALGMTTINAQRVTSAAVHAGSMAHTVRLWAPRWCHKVARFFLRFRGRQPVLAPLPTTTAEGKTKHYDVLRACVILAVSACVIATASGFKLPVSTTYVAFAAVIATGMADRILQRGDAELKTARTVWVVFSWLSAAVLAAVGAALACQMVYLLSWPGMFIAIAVNLALRHVVKKRSDAHETRVRQEARERAHPELYVEETEG